MSEQAIQETRYHLDIAQGLERQMNTLVVSARQLIDEFLANQKKDEQWDMGPTQMSNLLGVCGETESVEVVIGYVQYQIGRDDKRRNWGWRGFGDRLIEQLRARQAEAQALVSNAVRKTSHTVDSTAEDHVWMLLVRQYVGHLRRYFTYRRPRKEG